MRFNELLRGDSLEVTGNQLKEFSIRLISFFERTDWIVRSSIVIFLVTEKLSLEYFFETDSNEMFEEDYC